MVWAAAPALAQTGAGNIQGVVKDPTGAVIPAANITLVRIDTGRAYSATANQVGFYLMPALDPGQYKITAQAEGMQSWEGQMMLRTAETAVVNVTLAVGGTATEITVAGDVSPLIAEASSTVGSTVERERIEQLPLNGRVLGNLIQFTTPGVEGEIGFSRVHGLKPGSMEFVQDGAVLMNRDWGLVQDRPPGLDTVEEFRIETNNASAKNSRPAGAILKTKAGTNQIHGAAFETARNNGLGVARRRQDFYDKPSPLIRNEFGVSAGGPVVLPKLYDGRNRTFLFGAYEGFIRRQYSTKNSRVPTAAMREGDFSGLIDGAGRRIAIYDPWTTNSTWQRTPFPSNVIPLARRSPVAKHLNSITPGATLLDVNPLVGDNYFGPMADNRNEHTGTFRFDHRISDRDQVFFRYSYGTVDWMLGSPNSSAPITLDGTANVLWRYIDSHSGAFSWTRILNPTFFSETLVNFGRENRSHVSGDPNVKWAEKLGLPNPFGAPGLPQVGETGFAMNFVEGGNTQADYSNTWSVDQNFTKVAGRHEFQFGGRFRNETVNVLAEQVNQAGIHYYDSLATALYDPRTGSAYGATPQTGHNAANMFLGVFGRYNATDPKGWFKYSPREYAGYVQDNFRVNSRLTLNIGLRIESNPVLEEKNNLVSSFDPKTRSIVIGQPLETLYRLEAASPATVRAYQNLGVKFITADQAGMPEKLVRGDRFDYGPRLGFAYKILSGSKPLVVRGGYSKFSFPFQLRYYRQRARQNAPFITELPYQPELGRGEPGWKGQLSSPFRADLRGGGEHEQLPGPQQRLPRHSRFGWLHLPRSLPAYRRGPTSGT